MSEKKPITVKLEQEMRDQLQQLSKIKQRSVHWMAIEALKQYIERELADETLKQQTLSRWQEIEQGEVVDNKSVIDWLDTWGDKKDQELPG